MTEHPSKKTFLNNVIATAQAVTKTFSLFVAPYDCTVESVEYIPDASITGANTDTRKVSVINKGSAGAGTTEVAGLQFNSGVNATAFDSKAVTLSGTSANLNLTAGDVVSWKSEAVGNGLADGGGLVRIVVAKR